MLASVLADVEGIAGIVGDDATDALRAEYRTMVCEIAAFDLSAEDATTVLDRVARALADAAGAAIEASLAVARATLLGQGATRADLAHLAFAVIGMGKCGAGERNYVSDVDVIYVAESRNEEVLATETALTHATKLAQLLARGIYEPGREPGLWEVDANLRPEGKDGPLVRTLESHVRYYERWALESECVGGTLNKQADAFVSGTGAGATITGLNHLEGETVVVWVDGTYAGTKVVASASTAEKDLRAELGGNGGNAAAAALVGRVQAAAPGAAIARLRPRPAPLPAARGCPRSPRRWWPRACAA
jgi:hypothetical protein